jgi:hypothetical protein
MFRRAPAQLCNARLGAVHNSRTLSVKPYATVLEEERFITSSVPREIVHLQSTLSIVLDILQQLRYIYRFPLSEIVLGHQRLVSFFCPLLGTFELYLAEAK